MNQETQAPSAITITDKFELFRNKMHISGIAISAVRSFENAYRQLVRGETGFISSTTALPVTNLPELKNLQSHKELGSQVLNQTAVIKLNGGLGTSMGMQGPKTLLQAKGEHTFIDVLVNQILSLRRQHQARLPLLFMNSFSTQEETAEALHKHPELIQDVPVTFFENKVLKVDKETLGPASWPQNPKLEWAPPGHGDLFPALLSTGILEVLLNKGYKYAFVSNGDNLGAVADPVICGYMEAENIPFLMEVTTRTVNDKKGGHLAITPQGNLTLREIAQCPPEEVDDFQDIDRYKYFNTNNIWINLSVTKDLLMQNDGYFKLPMIINEKNIDPVDPSSPKVLQLESAMGAAINVYPGAQAICVGRDRFVPIKKTSDLLILWSDIYELANDYRLIARNETPSITEVKLDDNYYKFVGQMMERFPYGAPSLKKCSKFSVEGDIVFGKNVSAVGEVNLKNEGPGQMRVEDTQLEVGVSPF